VDQRLTLPLFVFGRFADGDADAVLLGPVRRTSARARGQLWVLRSGYPALVVGPSGDVWGELCEPPLPERILALLDDYEGVGQGLCAREPVEVRIGLRTHLAWTWVTEAARARAGRLVPTGRWRGVVRR
jgi:gamma-glutamylcyclotransferase (GGCT)/AIG2-like uncharacterized protein YtfP